MSATSHLHDPQALYRHWEEEQWNPWSIDLTTDRDQWQRSLSEEDKGLVYWALSSLMVAEERITTKFAGLVMAAESEEEASYLASQQVDEARHMQFYARFQDEVIAAPATITAHVARSREQLGDSFAVIFDQALVSAHERLAANPIDAFAKVDFVTIYHLVIESTLGLTAFEFITRYLTNNELLPGFVDGLQPHPPRDEQRNTSATGVSYLAARASEQRTPRSPSRSARLRDAQAWAAVRGSASPTRCGPTDDREAPQPRCRRHGPGDQRIGAASAR